MFLGHVGGGAFGDVDDAGDAEACVGRIDGQMFDAVTITAGFDVVTADVMNQGVREDTSLTAGATFNGAICQANQGGPEGMCSERIASSDLHLKSNLIQLRA
ncbi:hypothetical protein D3C86_1541390 [compost metagenome]